MEDYYQSHCTAYHEKTFRIDPSSFLEPLIKHLKPGASILDVGCGSGRDLLWMKERGFRVMGLESSKGLAALARKHANCEIIEGDFEIYDFPKLSIDAIIHVGALVHVPHDKMQAVFKHTTACLKQSGKALLTLKQGEGTQTDEHNRVFSMWHDHDLRMIFTILGFEVLDFRRQASKVKADDTWLGYVLGKRLPTQEINDFFSSGPK